MNRVALPGMPNLGRGYLGALASFARALPTDATRLPTTELVAEPVHLDAERVARYNVLCGFPPASVAITYPLVLTFPLQLALLTRADSPLRLPGLVHLGVDLRMTRLLRIGIAYRASCAVVSQDMTPPGLEFTVAVALEDEAGIAWGGESRILARRAPTGTRARNARPRAPQLAATVLDEFQASGNIGRRYAQVSGDWNPIHLGRLGARALGFDRPVAHGMWTLARVVAAASPIPTPAALTAEFLAPLKLPGRLRICGEAGRFGAVDAANGRIVASVEMKEVP